MIQKITLIITTTLLAFAAQSASAATAPYVGVDIQVQAGDTTVFNDTVYTNGCVVTDSDGEDFTYTSATALCALEAASLQGGFEYEMINSDYGLYLNEVTADETSFTGDFTSYWSFYVDYAASFEGLATYEITDGETILLTYGSYGAVDPLKLTMKKKQYIVGTTIAVNVKKYNSVTEEFVAPTGVTYVNFDDTTVTVVDGMAEFTPESAGSIDVYAYSDGNTESAITTVKVHPVKKKKIVKSAARKKMASAGHDYLLGEIDSETGLIDDSQSVTEWAAIGAGANGNSGYSYYDGVVNYEPTVDDGTFAIARHILALEALGIDSRNINEIDYVARLLKTRSNKQFGEEELVNDDIFAGLALLAADEPVSSKAVGQAVRASLAGKNADGGVSYSVAATVSDVDTTAFFVQLLAATKNQPGKGKFKINKQRRKAVNYIKKQQNLDGGWAYQRDTADKVDSNSSSTAVSISAMKTARKKVAGLKKNKQTPFNYLKSVQRKNGAFKYNLDGDTSLESLNTAYAIIALSGEQLPFRAEQTCSGMVEASATSVSCTETE